MPLPHSCRAILTTAAAASPALHSASPLFAPVFVFPQIREDWKYVAMVIDRLQLYIFFIVTAAGTLAILLDAPHIFEYVDQDKIIEMHKGKST